MIHAGTDLNLSNHKWHSMPLIDEERSEDESINIKRGSSAQIERNSSTLQSHGARSLEDMLTGQTTFPAMLLPTAVVKRSSLSIYEADKPTTVTVNSKGIELQEVTLRSPNEKSLGIIVELKTKRNGKAVKHEVYIKQFHQKGKAYLDGRLKVRDRIVKINGEVVGEANMTQFSDEQVWTFTIARSIAKTKKHTRGTCGIPKLEPQDIAQQMLCNKFLEGVNKKHLYKEMRTVNKKNWWEKVSRCSMGFEDLLTRSDNYVNITTEGVRVDAKRIAERSLFPTDTRDPKQLQMFYPQQQLFIFEPISEITSQMNIETIHTSELC
ncbi:hypothetical protein LOD99_12975 [Oopsacas minuta]|uniref:PDZ domain-containing protein n=1 Tax=Oopsacas minuta TaxID=111878 RepID=A0AAV7J800_9METZ|nr:hypothetical protein LOD99_12975 [Oopsacas minuta]